MKYNYLKLSRLVGVLQKGGKTLSEISKEISVGVATLQRINAGDKPSLDVLIKIANFFEKDMNYFFDFDGDELQIVSEPQSEDGVKNIDYYKKEAEIYKKLYDDLLERLVQNQASDNPNKRVS